MKLTKGSENMEKSKTWIAPEDYKIYCFNGEPKYIMVCVGRETGKRPKFYFFDSEWNLARINPDSKKAPQNFTMEKPKCLDRVLNYAKTLSTPFPFVRVDFYIVKEKIYFGELTFTPAGGMDSNRLPETDIMMGDLVDLNYKN